MALRAVVIGSGWAGEGHSTALRAAGVDVVALCGRSPAPTKALAERLKIPAMSLDWRETLREIRPDIVAIATTAAPHRDIAVTAAGLGCNVLCDKPLSVTALEAREMFDAVHRAGVKHAYGPASCLGPAITHARRLIADGAIGTLTGIASSVHFGWWRPRPYNWIFLTSDGGGLLNNGFTHKLAQVTRLTGGTPTHVAGTAHCYVTRAPVTEPIHDFCMMFSDPPETDEGTAELWKPVDADTSYSVVLQLALPAGGAVSARFDADLTSTSQAGDNDKLNLYGTKGTLVLSDGNSPRALHHYDFARNSWEELTIPADGDAEPWAEDYVQRDWNTLLARFAADIRGEPHDYYPTFEDGWLASEIIDLIRSGRAQVSLPRTLQ